jgi:hypothetical protein
MLRRNLKSNQFISLELSVCLNAHINVRNFEEFLNLGFKLYRIKLKNCALNLILKINAKVLNLNLFDFFFVEA